MSRTSREDCPQPPSVEEIIIDLRSAKASDVAFKSPDGFPSSVNSQDNSHLVNTVATSTREEIHQKQVASKQGDDIAKGAPQKAKQDEEIYNKVQEFLEHYKLLDTSVGKLNNIDNDLKSTESSLTQSIEQVKELWKVKHAES